MRNFFQKKAYCIATSNKKIFIEEYIFNLIYNHNNLILNQYDLFRTFTFSTHLAGRRKAIE